MSFKTENYADRKMIQRTICDKVDQLAIGIEGMMRDMDKDGRARQVVRRHLRRVRGFDINSIDYQTGQY